MRKVFAMILVLVMMLSLGATVFAVQEPRTTVNCCANCGDGLYFPDEDPHDDHDKTEPARPSDPYDYHHNGDGACISRIEKTLI
ncbi:MAG: hypothetical protein J5949_07905 [Oscillospiraceae bacterium]|nr:hypothetical protein [Oscillospiraceae bacterium]